MRAGKLDGARGGHVGGGAQRGIVNDKAACVSTEAAVVGHLQHAAAHKGAAAVQVGARQDERPVVVLDQGARAVQHRGDGGGHGFAAARSRSDTDHRLLIVQRDRVPVTV